MKWEHEVIRQRWGHLEAEERQREALAFMSKEGWELVSVVMSKEPNGLFREFFFKRPLVNEATITPTYPGKGAYSRVAGKRA